jgi:2-polyprenyl-3-methyl-5-hydroxy-6-metoxy-1,4-benzoquinol methylase
MSLAGPTHGFSLRAFAGRFPTIQERCYVACKLATDPLYPAVYAALRETAEPLLDVGCGMGLLAFYLRQRGWQAAITGVDFDQRKIATAEQLAGGFGPDLTFFQRDAAVALPDHRGSVTVLDVLQYFPTASRDAMLRKCAARVSPSGLLVIRTGIADGSLRYRLTHGMDRVATWLKWMKTPPIEFPRREELLGLLGEEGLIGNFAPLWGRTPFNNWLGVFRRSVD